jgi:hypothetical protein
MGVLDTTYTFTATDVVTSAKLNNVIDQTTFTATAVTGATLAVSASGQLRVNTITSNEMGSSSVNSTALATDSVTQTKIAPNVVGKGPLFRAYANSVTTLAIGGFTQITLDAETHDTNSSFSGNIFTPNVAGYYLIMGTISTPSSNNNNFLAVLYLNGSLYSHGTGQIAANSTRTGITDIIYMNGTTDFVELRGYHSSSATININTGSTQTYFSGYLVRSA